MVVDLLDCSVPAATELAWLNWARALAPGVAARYAGSVAALAGKHCRVENVGVYCGAAAVEVSIEGLADRFVVKHTDLDPI